MSIANLKKMKKELSLMIKESNKDKLIIKALDGLFLIDLSKTDEGKITPITEAPEGMDIDVIDANMNDILVCGGLGYEPVIIVNDIDYIDAPNVKVINIVPASKHFESIEKED